MITMPTSTASTSAEEDRAARRSRGQGSTLDACAYDWFAWYMLPPPKLPPMHITAKTTESTAPSRGSPKLGQAVAQVVHAAARDVTVRRARRGTSAERAFRELRGHAEEARDGHPEDGARPADAHGEGDARDVAEPDRRRERGRERLEVA